MEYLTEYLNKKGKEGNHWIKYHIIMGHVRQNKEAFRILKKRFLEGEISEEEFDRLKKDFDIKDD